MILFESQERKKYHFVYFLYEKMATCHTIDDYHVNSCTK
jgi:hypothetical protein